MTEKQNRSSFPMRILLRFKMYSLLENVSSPAALRNTTRLSPKVPATTMPSERAPE